MRVRDNGYLQPHALESGGSNPPIRLGAELLLHINWLTRPDEDLKKLVGLTDWDVG